MASILKAMAARLQNLSTPVTKPAAVGVAPSFEEIVEGSARVLHPKGAVFYNPAQVVNRDLSVLVLRYYARQVTRPLRILEALSATGLRSIRYFQEVPNVSHIIANDMDPNAVAFIRRSVELNGLNTITQVTPNEGDASVVMALAASQGHLFDVVDLDPYGSAAMFIEPAIRCLTDGGLLCVTCTDLPVLCGNSPEVCYSRYAATPLKSPTTHEMAIRIVFSAVQAAANRMGRAVEPVLCAKIDFYVRLFLRVKDSRNLAQQTPSMSCMIFQCADCGTQRFQPLGRIREIPAKSMSRRKRRCRNSDRDAPSAGIALSGDRLSESIEMDAKSKPVEHGVKYKFSPPTVQPSISSKCTICCGTISMGGPIWSGPLIGEEIAESLLEDLHADNEKKLKASDRVEAIIRLLDEEVPNVPLFMHLPSMCKTLNTSVPPAAAVRSVLTAKGHMVSQSHVDPGSLKTTAPPELVWDILRIWTRKVGSSLLRNISISNNDGSTASQDRHCSPGERILIGNPTLISPEDIDFSVKKDKFARRGFGQEKQAVRFPHNPHPNWGPKPRAGKRRRPSNP